MTKRDREAPSDPRHAAAPPSPSEHHERDTMSSITPTSASTGVTGTGSTGGKNTIADGVVEKVAGIAARQVPGVHDLGNGAARAVGAIRNVIGQQDRGQGISVEVGETQVVGMEVTEVNVTITDVNLPSDKSSDDDAAEKRVQ
ncbi:conserved hypothetical protein [Clavibacter sepedonicus]|uniref:Asp23/Gls24 family envelope stress response protein n=3 Tax=Clavibacter TaxID=1573 RepID=B0RFG2_CLASE|nr:conserved hypothetical protein [Clavibacter sepedonicus]